MISLSVLSGLLRVDFTRGPLIPEGDVQHGDECDCDVCDTKRWRARQERINATEERPAVACRCELAHEPGEHPTCSEFRPSILHDDLCIDCYHAKECHR